MSDFKHPFLLGVTILALVSSVAVPAAASVQLSVSSDYGGVDADSEAVEITIELSPKEESITDVVVDISGTDQGFVDYDSFDRSVSPGNADVDVTYRNGGEFHIDELNPDESVTITYEAYPRTINEEELDVSVIGISYVQLGQELDQREVVTADLSNSAWHELQDREGSEESVTRWATIGKGLAGANAVILVAGLLYWYFLGGPRDDFDMDDEDEVF